MKSVALHNLGCKVNGYELDVMQQMLQENGYKIVPFDEQADIYIVNTCTVTNIADRKSRQMLHRARRLNPEAVVVAAGCYVQTGREAILRDAGVDLLVGNNRKKDLVAILEEYMKRRNEKTTAFAGEEGGEEDRTLDGTTICDIAKVKDYENMTLQSTAEHTRAGIKIQDGCNQFCSYCIIPYARGRVRSRPVEDILAEIRGLAGKGYKEAVLTGIHISSYGTDFQTQEIFPDGGNRTSGRNQSNGLKQSVGLQQSVGLLELLRRIHEIEGIERIRLGSLEPGIVTEEFAEGIRDLPKVCPHFHLSLQSGCDETLKRMNRHYTTGEYYEKVKLLRGVYNDPAITTDVIVGFPGETEEEFEATRDFLEKLRFYEMHVFKYSRRDGTRAAAMGHQVPDRDKTQRSVQLLAMERRHSREYRARYIDKEVQVLFEEEQRIEGKIYQTGHTAQYVKVAKETGEKLSNCMRTGRITGFLTDEILRME